MNVLVLTIKTEDKLFLDNKLLECSYIIYDIMNDTIISEGDGIPKPDAEVYSIVGYDTERIINILVDNYPTFYDFVQDKAYLCIMKSGCRAFGANKKYLTFGKLCELLQVPDSKYSTLDCLNMLFEKCDGLLKYEKIKIKKPN